MAHGAISRVKVLLTEHLVKVDHAVVLRVFGDTVDMFGQGGADRYEHGASEYS